jgi:hypothetical protein
MLSFIKTGDMSSRNHDPEVESMNERAGRKARDGLSANGTPTPLALDARSSGLCLVKKRERVNIALR